MPFWNVRRGSQATLSEGSTARALEPHLERIQLFTAHERVDGWMVAQGERITDLLNQRPALRVCIDPTADAWVDIARDDLLIVAPPPLPPSPRRIHRQKHRVLAVLGPYTVEGIAHLAPGVPLDPYLLRSRQRFMAMTNALIGTAGDPDTGEPVSVAIVNVDNVDELRGILTIA